MSKERFILQHKEHHFYQQFPVNKKGKKAHDLTIELLSQTKPLPAAPDYSVKLRNWFAEMAVISLQLQSFDEEFSNTKSDDWLTARDVMSQRREVWVRKTWGRLFKGRGMIGKVLAKQEVALAEEDILAGLLGYEPHQGSVDKIWGNANDL